LADEFGSGRLTAATSAVAMLFPTAIPKAA
jgi:hypothetical protein